MAPDMHETSQMLAERIQQLAPELMGGQPSQKGRLEWRFGNRGSLAVVIAGADRGQWFDHEAGQGGDALEMVVHARQCIRRDAWQWALAWLGGDAAASPLPARPAQAETAPPSNPGLWKAVWRESTSAAGSPVETYLASRGLFLAAGAPLKFHPACPRKDPKSPGKSERFPAMLAIMTDPVSGVAVGVHRTFLRPDGRGKADVTPAKMMLGNAGIIRLVPDSEVTSGLGICEGIENGLAVMQHAGWSPIWAAGSAGAIARFPVLAGIECLTIFADHDPINRFGKQPGLETARTCGDRWVAAGRYTVIQKPPAGTDWLDALGRAA